MRRPRVTIYNTSDWSKLSNPSPLPSSTGVDVAFSPTDDLMAVAHASSHYSSIYDTTTWTRITNPSILPGSTANGVAFLPMVL